MHNRDCNCEDCFSRDNYEAYLDIEAGLEPQANHKLYLDSYKFWNTNLEQIKKNS